VLPPPVGGLPMQVRGRDDLAEILTGLSARGRSQMSGKCPTAQADDSYLVVLYPRRDLLTGKLKADVHLAPARPATPTAFTIRSASMAAPVLTGAL